MKDLKQKVGPSVPPQTSTMTTREAASSDQVERDADEMADQASRTEQAFDDQNGAFDKI